MFLHTHRQPCRPKATDIGVHEKSRLQTNTHDTTHPLSLLAHSSLTPTNHCYAAARAVPAVHESKHATPLQQHVHNNTAYRKSGVAAQPPRRQRPRLPNTEDADATPTPRRALGPATAVKKALEGARWSRNVMRGRRRCCMGGRRGELRCTCDAIAAIAPSKGRKGAAILSLNPSPPALSKKGRHETRARKERAESGKKLSTSKHAQQRDFG